MKTLSDQEREFREHYGAFVEASRREYHMPIQVPLHIGNNHSLGSDTLRIEIKKGVDLSMMEDDYQQLIQDAAAGREFTQMRSRHPGVLQAWDQYRVMMALAYRSEGRDLP